MGLEQVTGLPMAWFYPARIFLVLATVLIFSWSYVCLRSSAPLASIALGTLVFLLWIGPDLLFGYRHFWLFENALLGKAASNVPADLQRQRWFEIFRAAGCTLLVPVIEEMFWRGWLMRWLISRDFRKIPVGTYSSSAFWIVALLFAAEHGPYWEVGLVTGILYNWWAVRTRSLADCILAHAITNGLLSAYVLTTGQWQYWL